MILLQGLVTLHLNLGCSELLRRLLHQGVQVLATVVADAHVVRINELFELLHRKVLPDDFVVGLGPIAVAQIQFLQLLLGPLQLLPHVVRSLVLLLLGKLGLRQY